MIGSWFIALVAALGVQAPAAELVPSGTRAGNAVARAGVPGFRVGVPADAVYVGADRFIIRGVADAEVHVFVEAGADRTARRIYWLQFEEYLPDNAHTYQYAAGNDRRRLWGVDWWVGVRQLRGEASAGSDRSRVNALIESAGYRVPEQLIRARLVHLPDDRAGRGEGAAS